jgi:ParB-like chromosome segregation protein Spo0J
MSNKKPTHATPAIHCQHSAMMPIEDLRPHPRNPNRHGDEQIALLAKNIRHLGWRHPILVSGLTGFIVAGHARLEAAKVLNLAEVPVDVQPFTSETEEVAYLIADNRIAELAEMQTAIIKDLLQELDTGATDMNLTGYSEAEIERLMLQYHVTAKETQADARAAEEATETTTPETQEAYEREMQDRKTQGTAPIIPKYAEHHQAFVIVCENAIDEAFIRNKLGLELPMQSYKDVKVRQCNVATGKQFREMFQ